MTNLKQNNLGHRLSFFRLSRWRRRTIFQVKTIIRRNVHIALNFINPVETYLLHNISAQGGLAYKQQWYKRSDGIAYLVIFPMNATRMNELNNILTLVIIKNLGIHVGTCAELLFESTGINAFVCNTKQAVDRVLGPKGILFQVANDPIALGTPTDQDLIDARLMAETDALQASGLKAFPNAGYLTGDFDNEPAVKLRLEGIKHGRYLNRRDTIEILTKPQHWA